METVAQAIWEDMSRGLKGKGLKRLDIVVRESDVATATYTRSLPQEGVNETESGGSFAVTVTDRVMVSHSFKGEAFGPAQKLHGTYTTILYLYNHEQGCK